MADPRDRRPTPPPIGGFVATSEAAALWRAREEDRYVAEKKFDRIETGMKELHEDMGEVKVSVANIEAGEARKNASAEKRNQRLWQFGSAVMVSLLVAVIIALWKVFAPIAIIGNQVKPQRVNDTLDEMHAKLDGHGER